MTPLVSGNGSLKKNLWKSVDGVYQDKLKNRDSYESNSESHNINTRFGS
jgi:hypothetical protein